MGQKFNATRTRKLVSAANQLSERLQDASAAGWRETLAGILENVTLGSDHIQIQIFPRGLLEKLGVSAKFDRAIRKCWVYEIPYVLRNRGRQLRILPEDAAQSPTSRPDPTLLKLFRRAYDWRRQLETGPSRTVAELAAANSVNASYFTRVLRVAYLAPDIVEAILAGDQPPELTANKLIRLKNLPIDWPGQRQFLGFPAA